MKRIVFTCFVFSLLLITQITKAQLTYQWANSAGGTLLEYGQAIAVDPSGNVYVCGTFSGTVDFDPSASTANLTGLSTSQDIFLAKYTSAGAFVWVKQIGGTNSERAYDVACDASGVWLAGNFMGTCDFDPSASTSNTTALGGGSDGDGFFAKYDVNGNYQWGVRIGSTANDRVMGIAIDGSQNCYITGFIGFNTDFDATASSFSLNVASTYNAYFAKYTPTGNLTFAKQITGPYSDGYDIHLDGSNNIYITGSFGTGTCDFDPSAATANLSTASTGDAYFARYDNAGNYSYANKAGGPGIDIGFQIRTDASGNIYMGGTFSNGCDFDPTATTSVITNAGSGDLFAAKYSSAGALAWAVGTGGTQNDYCYGLGVDGSGNVYITGRFQGTNIDFDPSASSNFLTATALCPYFAGYNSSGGFLFASQPGNVAGEGRHLIVNGSSVYTTGFFDQTGDFDFSASTANLTSLGSGDIFFAKYNVCGGSPPAQPSIITGSNNICIGTSQSYSVTNDPTATGYVWSFPSGWSGTSSTNSITATSGTTGTISVAASNSCGLSPYSTLNVTVNPLPTPTFTNSGPVCSGSSLVIGANGATSYTIYGPNSFAQITQSYTFANATPIIAGVYTVIVTSAAGCTAVAQTTVVINSPPAQPTAINGATLLCTGTPQNYSVAAVATATSYSWSYPSGWSGSSTTNMISLISGTTGIISVAATNSCGTSPSSTINVSVGGFTNSAISATNVSCNGGFNGKAIVTFTGGVGPYSFTWTPSSQSTPTLNNVGANNYTVVVSDSYGCTIQKTVTITQPSQLILSTITASNISCFGAANGSINAIASGGTPTYTYSWVSSSTFTPGPSPTANTIPPGNYTLTTLDANGCSTFSVYTITQPSTLTTSSTNTSPACSSPNGSATVVFTGGTGPYAYTWNAPLTQTTNTINGLAAGNYTITCTDSHNCVTTQTLTIPSGGSPTILTTVNPTLICAGQTVTLTVSGANTYTWSNSSNANTITVTPSVTTTYSVTGTTTAGCTGTSAKSVSVNPAPSFSVTTSNSVICMGQTAILTANGANSYTWSTSSNSNSIIVSPTITTSYTLSGTTSLGCVGSTVITQNVSSCTGIITLTTNENNIEIYPNPFKDFITIKGKENTTIEITNSLGQLILKTNLLSSSQNINTENFAKGIYFIRVVNNESVKPIKLIKE